MTPNIHNIIYELQIAYFFFTDFPQIWPLTFKIKFYPAILISIIHFKHFKYIITLYYYIRNIVGKRSCCYFLYWQFNTDLLFLTQIGNE